ncbi:MAG: tRNA (adenosine(37)-N6)-dimethylallyltransferase MiaA [Clostridia bacterium]|nr:tRNA (adenosine(37)-N6)-dimethylallyltransferase MiaA [Clostridia bacterium]
MSEPQNLQPIYVVGPTASGKSALALELAKEFDGVIISADSMQIYRGLDVGTAKESKEIRDLVPHKMIDVVDADEEFSVAEYADMAKKEIENALNGGKLPIVVGGTGLYFEALIFPMSFANTVKNPELREKLAKELEEYGAEYLHEKLEKLDKKTAERLHTNDTKRVIRALEIILTTGKTLDENKDEQANDKPNVIMIGLNTDRAKLYERINERVDEMFAAGLVDEVYSVGSFDYQSMQAIGYKEFADAKPQKIGNNFVLDDETLAEIKDKIKQHTRNYAKRQLTWFRKYDFVKWFDCSDISLAVEYVRNVLRCGNN